MMITIYMRKSTASYQGDDSLHEWRDHLSYAQQQRLKFFEAKLLWEGQVNRQDLCRQFHLTPNHLTRDLRDYKRALPGNIWYDEVTRAYRPTERFVPVFTSGRADEYLAFLRLYALTPSSAVAIEIGAPVPCDALPTPMANISSEILRAVLLAIHMTGCCEIVYQSLSREKPQKRHIWPHALVWAGDRWHVRAYDDIREAFIDVVLARIKAVSTSDAPPPASSDRDVDWCEIETFNVIPHPRLSSSQKCVIAEEYGMLKGERGYYWPVSLRRCLIPYFIDRYRLDVGEQGAANSNCPARRIALEDKAIADRYAFPNG